VIQVQWRCSCWPSRKVRRWKAQNGRGPPSARFYHELRSAGSRQTLAKKYSSWPIALNHLYRSHIVAGRSGVARVGLFSSGLVCRPRRNGGGVRFLRVRLRETCAGMKLTAALCPSPRPCFPVMVRSGSRRGVPQALRRFIVHGPVAVGRRPAPGFPVRGARARVCRILPDTRGLLCTAGR